MAMAEVLRPFAPLSLVGLELPAGCFWFDQQAPAVRHHAPALAAPQLETAAVVEIADQPALTVLSA